MTSTRRIIFSWLAAPILAKVGLAQEQSPVPAPAVSAEAEDGAAASEREPFLPSRHGFWFRNSFTGTPISLGGLERRLGAEETYGLCGGMCFAALDRWHAGEDPPDVDRPPETDHPLYAELLARQLDSLGPYASLGLRFMRWMRLPDAGEGGVRHLTAVELQAVSESLERGEPVVLGLVYPSDNWHPWGNHQVLGYAIETPEGEPDADDERPLFIALYDPNFPARDDVRLRLTPTREPAAGASEPPADAEPAPGGDGGADAAPTLPGFRVELVVPGRRDRAVRGVFAMPYAPKAPRASD